MLSKLQMATRLMPFCQERDGCMSAVAATPAMDRTMPASSNMSWVIIMLASMAYTMAMRCRLRFSGAVRMRRAMAEVRPLPLPRHPTWGENSARIFGRYSGRKFTGELSSRHSLLDLDLARGLAPLFSRCLETSSEVSFTEVHSRTNMGESQHSPIAKGENRDHTT